MVLVVDVDVVVEDVDVVVEVLEAGTVEVVVDAATLDDVVVDSSESALLCSSVHALAVSTSTPMVSAARTRRVVMD
jgi:hypothetical protein